MPNEIRAAVFQLGARMHFAVPRAFSHAGMLQRFVTDLWFPKIPVLLKPFAGKNSSLLSRQHSAVSSALVAHFPIFALRYARSLRNAKNRSDQTKAFLDFSSEFATKCLPFSRKANLIYGFNSALLEVLQAVPSTTFTVLEQTLAPRISEQHVLSHLPGYESDRFSSLYEEREKQEWAKASLIVCGSAFVQSELIALGVDASKIEVIPYGFGDVPTPKKHLTSIEKTPLKLLFVGNGALRKGLPSLLEAVAALGSKVQLTVAGQLQLPDGYSLPIPNNVTVLGSVPRAKMTELYQSNDVFVLPSLCEGSATVTYEALHYGLPVICTPNTGSVVTDRLDGRLVPVNDTIALREAIEGFFSADVLSTFSENALKTATRFTAQSYGERLINVLERRFRQHQSD